MSQQNDELPFFDYVVDESEHPTAGGADRPGDTRAPTDRAAPAFPRPTTNVGPPTAPGFASVATYPVHSPGISAASHPFGRLSPGSESPYSSGGGSPAVSAHANIPIYEYAFQQPSPNPFMGSYPIQGATSSTMEFSPWANTGSAAFGDTTMLYGADPMTMTSPILGFSPMNGTSESTFTDSDRPNLGDLNNAMQIDPSLQLLPGDSPRNKHAKMSPEQDVAGARTPGCALMAAGPVPEPNNSGGSEHGKSKLRSASRSSKNTSRRPGESVDERKTRNAHNLVEKQYRNRLNAQFEGLLNALPESIRSPNSAAAGGPSDSDPNVDLGERRLSKGDVLEMSTRYIKTLERDCHRLEKEREELGRNVERLQAMLSGQSSMQEGSFSGG
ncbi:hypothetical protein OQA88_381 [Cercophora sp. LCS_1]